MVKKAVIPVAGLGTRFLPITKVVPKELLPILNKPALDYIIDEARASGIEDIYLIVNKDKQSIIDYYSEDVKLKKELEARKKKQELETLSDITKDVRVHFVYQKEPKGLGHAILQAKKQIGDEKFAILLGDEIYVNPKAPALKQLIDVANNHDGHILGTMLVSDEDTKKYGICIPKIGEKAPTLKLDKVIEKPETYIGFNIATSGRYVLDSAIFEFIEKQTPSKRGEIELTDAIFASMEVKDVYAHIIDAKRYDIGTKSEYIKAIIDFSLQEDDIKDEIKEYITK